MPRFYPAPLNRHEHIKRLIMNFGTQIRPQYADLALGPKPLTWDQIKDLHGNSAEWRVLHAALDNESYVQTALHNLLEAGGVLSESRVAHGYDEVVIGQIVPQLIERLRDAQGWGFSQDPERDPWTFGGWHEDQEDMLSCYTFEKACSAITDGQFIYVRQPGGLITFFNRQGQDLGPVPGHDKQAQGY